MNSKLRRRMIMAAGASITGVAIPIAAACNAWADTEITYDGYVLYDDFDLNHPFLSPDTGTEALSGTHNDWAIVYGPHTDAGLVGLANDSSPNDTGDFALYSATTGPTSVYGEQGATIINATNSDAEVFGGGNASINGIPANLVFDPVSNSAAIASNGGFAGVENDGLGQGVAVTNDFAYATGTAVNNGAATESLGHGTTPSVANIYDSGYSDAFANNTGTNLQTGDGGAAIDLANNSDAYAVNAGSASDIEGGVNAAGVPLSTDVPIANVTNIEPDGDVFVDHVANSAVFDGVPYLTFVEDLFGAGGQATMTADWTALLAYFGI